MTDAELRCTREHLGVTGDWLAGRLGVSPRSVRHWEAGTYPIPDGVRDEVEALEQEQAAFVTDVIGEVMAGDDTALIVYRDDVAFRAEHPGSPWSAGWHRAAMARVARTVPGLQLRYLDPPSAPLG